MKNLIPFQLLVSFTLILSTSCIGGDKLEKKAELVISRSGQNGLELQKVLDYYSSAGEKQKYEAACFLIANMPNKYTRVSHEAREI